MTDIERARAIVRKGLPRIKSPQTLEDVNFLGFFYKKHTGRLVNCRWCNRGQVWRFAKGYLEKNNLL